MPTIHALERYSNRLKGVHLITGEGLSSNIYILGRKRVTLIDTGIGNDANTIWSQLNEIGVEPEDVGQIVLTHSHHDHAMGLFRILNLIKPVVYIHKNALENIRMDIPGKITKVDDGFTLDTEIFPLRVIWTPGHTEGGISLFQEEKGLLFSGDTVFPGGSFGRFDLYSGNLPKLIRSLKNLSELDVEVMLPGHGSPIFQDASSQILASYENAVMLYKSR
jgi:glyoxylase-like metal-dependent hydrolase (beta-lactamase superfamily II)